MPNSAIKFTELPAPAESLLSVIRYCSKEETTLDHLTSLIKVDPLLTAELLKIVNSAYFGFESEINSINRLTVILGLKTIRSLALCIAIKEVSSKNTIKGFDDQLYWQDSIRRAAISSLLGEQLDFDKDECFTAGLLQDIGLLVMFSQPDNHEKFMKNYRHYNPDVRSVLEQDEFTITHSDAASFLETQWSLPKTLVHAITEHHQSSSSESQLEDVLYCTDWLNAFFTLSDQAAVYQQCLEVMSSHLKLDQAQTENIIKALPSEIENLTAAFGSRVDVNADFEDIMTNASQKLAEHNLELQELTWRLKGTISERDKLAKELSDEIQIAKDVQQALLPPKDETIPIHAFNVAARELSGDFYDYFTQGENIYFCLGDVSGKGVYASLLMVKASSLFRSLCVNLDDLSDIATQINQELCRIVVRGMFVTMVIGVYQRSTHQVSIVNAGHLPMLQFDKNGTCNEFEAKSPPFGIVENQQYIIDSVNIEQGCIYLYSDGVTESFLNSTQEPKEMLGIKGLSIILKKLNELPVEKRLLTMLNGFTRSQQELKDDTTMLLLTDK